MADNSSKKLSKCSFEIRFAKRNDVPAILELIQHLADYEKLSEEAVGTIPLMEAALFSEGSHTECLIATVDEKPVGLAIYFFNFSTFLSRAGLYLEDLFVLEQYRGLGIGKALFQSTARIAVEKECGRMEWAVLDWNQPAIEFYQSMDAKLLDGWTTCRLTGDALLNAGN